MMTSTRTWARAAAAGLTGLSLAMTGALAGSLGGAGNAVVTAEVDSPRTWEYVALGDSYTAGPLIPVQDPLGRGCFRSLSNYPHLLAERLKVASLTDVSCSAARTSDLRRPQDIPPEDRMPPQYDALSRSTDLVTIGIGGNDYGLFGSMLETCPAVRDRNPEGKPCKRAFTTKQGVNTKLRDTRRIGRRLGVVVDEVQAMSPRATVLVIGYPRLLPKRGICDEVPFARGDYRWADRVERSLNRHIRENVAAAGGRFVGLYRSSRGHHICAGDRAWINGKDTNPRAFEYHPYRESMANAATQIRRVLVTMGRLG